MSTQTADRRALFQTDRMAMLLIDVLRSQVLDDRFTIHDFVVMPDHIHLLITVPGDITLERAVQFIKGGFSFRAKKELGFNGEVWQKSFSEVGVRSNVSFLEHRRYIDQNPVKAGLSNSPEEYPYCSAHLKQKKQRLDRITGSGAKRAEETAGG